jgi:hypothetical protein
MPPASAAPSLVVRGTATLATDTGRRCRRPLSRIAIDEM